MGPGCRGIHEKSRLTGVLVWRCEGDLGAVPGLCINRQGLDVTRWPRASRARWRPAGCGEAGRVYCRDAPHAAACGRTFMPDLGYLEALASALATVHFTPMTLSGLSEMESMPASTRKAAKSG